MYGGSEAAAILLNLAFIEAEAAAADAAGPHNKPELSAEVLDFVSPVLGWVKGNMNAGPCRKLLKLNSTRKKATKLAS